MELDASSFWVFLFVSVLVVHGAGRTPAVRSWILLGLSVVYALTWGRTTLPVLLLLGVGTLVWTRVIAKRPERKTLWLGLGIGTLIIPLVLFKYIPPAASALGAPITNLALPVGISYVTFSCISHLVEAAESPAAMQNASLRDTLTALLFFPKLVSGPITRADEMFPQLEKMPRLDDGQLRYGLLLLIFGVTKKHLADLLARVVHGGFDVSSAQLSSVEAWVAVLAFAAQLYAEFSGYTDMARGAGALLGVELPVNFNLPYLARSPVDFWARWHISLSSWLRDYLFLPIAVHGRWVAPGVALLTTMTLGGLWHGASLKFVLWGLYHAALIATSYALGFGLRRIAPRLAASRLLDPLRILATFFFMLVGLTIFRAPTAAAAGAIVRSLLGASTHAAATHNTKVTLFLVLFSLVVPHLIDFVIGNWVRATSPEPRKGLRPVAYWAAAAVCVAFLILTGGAESDLPLYARF